MAYTASSSSTEGYAALHGFLEQECGIVLSERRLAEVAPRLRAFLAQGGGSSVGALVGEISVDPRLRGRVLKALTAPHHGGSIDAFPFDVIKRELLGRSKPVRIWVINSPSALDAYALAALIEEQGAYNALPRPQVLVTEPSAQALQVAEAGVFEVEAVRECLGMARAGHFFNPAAGGRARVSDVLRRHISLGEQDLREDFAALGSFDAIVCRNVLSYFSREQRRDILLRLSARLNARGLLIPGDRELLSDAAGRLDLLRFPVGAVYRARTNLALI